MLAAEFVSELQDSHKIAHVQLQAADLQAVRCHDLTLSKCTFENVDFSLAELPGLHATHCKFINCKFVQANLQEAALANTIFYRSSTKTIFWRANLRSASFSECDLRLCDFERADLYRAEFDQVNALGTNFFMARFDNAVKITNSFLRYAVFTGANLEKCVLTNNVFIQAIFQGAKLAGANLLGCDLSGVTWRYADVKGVDVRGANIPSFDLRTMDLTGIKIFESQQRQLLETADVVIFPDNKTDHTA